MDEPQAEQLAETLDHCGAPRAAGGADTSQAWYQAKTKNKSRPILASSCVMALLLAQSALTLNAPPGVLSPDAQHVVYIIGGQSQAAGKGLTNELTSKERDSASALGDRVIVEYPSVSRDIDPCLLYTSPSPRD